MNYQKEAAVFVETMNQLAADLQLDYSIKSIADLESFIADHFDPPGSKFVGSSLIMGVGCYIGEVITRNLGGQWHKGGQPEINGLGQIEKIFPVQKAAKRFGNGPQDALTDYINVIKKYAKR